jgi:hypothetical protein
MCAVLYDKVKNDGWKEPGLERSTTHYNTSIDEFKDAHVNHHLTQNNEFVVVFYFPKSKPSELAWVIFSFHSDGRLQDSACLKTIQLF